MTERPEDRRPGEPVAGEKISSDAPVGPRPDPEVDQVQQAIEESAASPATGGPEVPMATGSGAAYTTGTLVSGEVGPAVTKPEHEGTTLGEGPVRAVQDEDSEEFRESRVEGEDS